MLALPAGPQFHFDTIDHRARTGGAQTVSAGLHFAIILALLFLVASAPTRPLFRSSPLVGPSNKLLPSLPPPDAFGHALWVVPPVVASKIRARRVPAT